MKQIQLTDVRKFEVQEVPIQNPATMSSDQGDGGNLRIRHATIRGIILCAAIVAGHSILESLNRRETYTVQKDKGYF